jgi:hypothetical protein
MIEVIEAMNVNNSVIVNIISLSEAVLVATVLVCTRVSFCGVEWSQRTVPAAVSKHISTHTLFSMTVVIFLTYKFVLIFFFLNVF